MGAKFTIIVEKSSKNQLINAIGNYLNEVQKKQQEKIKKLTKEFYDSIIDDDKHELNKYHEEVSKLMKEKEKINKQINEIGKEMVKNGYNFPNTSKVLTIKKFKEAATCFMSTKGNDEITTAHKELQNLSKVEHELVELIKNSETEVIAIERLEKIGVKVEILNSEGKISDNIFDSIQHLL